MLIYYSVIVKVSKGEPWGVEFGDFDKDIAESEMEYLKESGEYYKVKIIKTACDQNSINIAVQRLNSWFVKG